ncbi:MAG: RagB/SusD family nutrient uptake outer membrane protein [Prolixibacteraceae bacterium]
MKKYLISLLLLSGMVLSGCTDFLEVVPESSYSVNGAYQTENDFVQAIAGVYSVQQTLYQSALSWFYGINGVSDDRRSSTYLYGLDNFTADGSNSFNLSQYQIFWRIIQQSNLIIEKINGVEFTDEALKGYIKGEACILRAFAYWNLAWQWGGMPLIDRSLTVEETKTIARSTREETLAFAAADYKQAAELLPVEWTGANIGRATKYAAKGMLARLYLFQSNFSEAKPLLSDIISSNKYAMEPLYINCFTDSHDNGTERVWEVQFTGGQLGEGQTYSTGCFPQAFNDKAILPFQGVNTDQRASDTLYNCFDPADLRRNLSIKKGYLTTTGIVDRVTNIIVKFAHFDKYTPQISSDWANNLPILRYTDVKMMYAEGLNEEGYVANGQAFTILNEVRARAGLPAVTATDLPDQATFREAIRKERRLEFAFEGLRWYDLLRWGIAKEVMNEFLALPSEGGGRYSMKDHQKIFPIPNEELSRYGDETIMWQNPEY